MLTRTLFKTIPKNQSAKSFAKKAKKLNRSQFEDKQSVMIRKLKRKCQQDKDGFYELFDSQVHTSGNMFANLASLGSYVLISGLVFLFADSQFGLLSGKKDESQEQEDQVQTEEVDRYITLVPEDRKEAEEVDQMVDSFIDFFNTPLPGNEKKDDQKEGDDTKTEGEEDHCKRDLIDRSDLHKEIKDIYQSTYTTDNNSQILKDNFHWFYLLTACFFTFKKISSSRKHGAGNVYKILFNPDNNHVKYLNSSKQWTECQIDKQTSYNLRDNSLIARGTMIGFGEYRIQKEAYIRRIEILKLLGDYEEHWNDDVYFK